MEKKHKIRTGKVISNKMDKTVVVLVETLRRHPLYKKVVKRTSKFKAHDETNACKIGDTVRIVETRPLSKEKHWRVTEIVTRKESAEVEPKEIV
ncbi:MAG TPA: 30S ribosomal protein S17 [Dehalococcoidia bacterium]|nr:30S ribosomal protein S17 [Dehalococcoidia bacterium]